VSRQTENNCYSAKVGINESGMHQRGLAGWKHFVIQGSGLSGHDPGPVVWLVARLLVCDGTRLGGCVAVEKGERRSRPAKGFRVGTARATQRLPVPHRLRDRLTGVQAHRGSCETVSPK
jgi:hypothetical protein